MPEEKWSLSIKVKRLGYNGPRGVSVEQWNEFALLISDLVAAEEQELDTPYLQPDDPDIERMLAALAAVGIDVFGDKGPTVFHINKQISYSSDDYDQAIFLAKPRVTLGLGTALNSAWCDARGILRLDGKLTPQTRDFGLVSCPLASLLVTRREALRAFNNSGLIGLTLPEVEIISKRLIESDERVRAVWSNIIMPPALNLYSDSDQMICGEYDDLRDRNIQGRLFNGYFAGFGELHYSKGAIASLGEFDIALVRESQFIARESPGTVIVSQRFRSFVKDAFGLEVTGVPVRIQSDETIPWEGPYPSFLAHKNRRPKWLEQGLVSPESYTSTFS